MRPIKVNKVLQIIFVSIFIVMIVVPCVFTNQQDGKISTAENRTLTSKPKMYTEDGTFNTNYITDFENWFNDNVGFRAQIVLATAKIKFNIFDQLSNSTDYYLGPKGELNYATGEMIDSYAHTNLYDDKFLDEVAAGFQTVDEYLEANGTKYFYYQCWDKHSIYPEYFMDTINQYGDVSRADQIVDTISKRTTVTVVSPKNLLIEKKKKYDTYSVWGDATHWTQRGAFISYQQLMGAINAEFDNKYLVLQESDYDITMTDQGTTAFGGIHKVDMEENFSIKNPKATQTNEEPLFLSMWQNKTRTIFENPFVDNEDTLVILGDSYFDGFIADDLAESFRKTVLIWGDYTSNLKEIEEYYHPTIIISENAERCLRMDGIINAAATIYEQ